MTPPVTVIGSGASGVHFALSLLQKGHRVRMVDVGRAGRPPALPDANLPGLKERLDDPVEYFLGHGFGAVLLPGANGEYYGTPPGKDFVFEALDETRHRSTGFAPLFSFAQGGLAEAWTGGCYPLSPDESADFPFPPGDLARAYDEVARRIGISGAVDDLARFMPVHAHLQPPLRFDEHSARLMAKYSRVRDQLNRDGTFVGRTRVATISQSLGSRQPCDYRGRCLWGCPHGALYTPSQTLRECRTFSTFEYVSGVEVRSFRLSAGRRMGAVVGRRLDTGDTIEFPAQTVGLAAGALLSTRIFLETIRREGGGFVRLPGLMDNRQVLVPFINFAMLGRHFSADTYQYHLLGMGLEGPSPADYVHGQITTLKTALTHPLIQRVPLDLGSATTLFRGIHAALGLVNVNFRDTRRDESFVELTGDAESKLRIHYAPDSGEPARVRSGLARVRRALRKLGCLVPPGLTHVRPMGASVHYAGTLPMTVEATPFTTTPTGQSRDIDGLFLVDGATFPFLPAKNITFTLMANAVRIAEAAF